jgi:hypothetical protein
MGEHTYNPARLLNRKRQYKPRGPRPDVSIRNRAIFTQHGMTDSPTFKSWDSMKQRCFNPKDKDYANYGGRGIDVDPRWLRFEAFFADMGKKPSGKTLGRKDNDRGYWPWNCEWQTCVEQNNNRRSSRTLTVGDDTLTLAQWARRVGTSRQAIRYRLEAGWLPVDIVSSTFSKSLRRKPQSC